MTKHPCGHNEHPCGHSTTSVRTCQNIRADIHNIRAGITKHPCGHTQHPCGHAEKPLGPVTTSVRTYRTSVRTYLLERNLLGAGFTSGLFLCFSSLAEYAAFWEHALREISTPSSRICGRRWDNGGCSWHSYGSFPGAECAQPAPCGKQPLGECQTSASCSHQ